MHNREPYPADATVDNDQSVWADSTIERLDPLSTACGSPSPIENLLGVTLVLELPHLPTHHIVPIMHVLGQSRWTGLLFCLNSKEYWQNLRLVRDEMFIANRLQIFSVPKE